jgi:hypothetical protein
MFLAYSTEHLPRVVSSFSSNNPARCIASVEPRNQHYCQLPLHKQGVLSLWNQRLEHVESPANNNQQSVTCSMQLPGDLVSLSIKQHLSPISGNPPLFFVNHPQTPFLPLDQQFSQEPHCPFWRALHFSTWRTTRISRWLMCRSATAARKGV